ncbi:hypothetical protein VPH35_098297 [Triticum aestivum]
MGPSCHLPCSTTVAVLLWCITVCLTLHAVRAQSATFTSTVAGKEFTTFSFPTFDRSLMQLPANLTFAGNSSVTQNTLQITPDSNSASGPDNFLVNQTGSVFLSSPFVLYVASFSTVFRINLYRANATNKGEGLAFVVASSNGGGGPPPGSHGGYLGLTNASTDGDAANGFAAVELDTVKQPYDPDDNHVGLDVNGVRSTHAASLTPFGIQLAPIDTTVNDGFYMVWVDYDGESRRVRAYVAKNGSRPGVPVLDAPLDLSAVLLGKRAYFGFSASTGVKYQFNCVRMWNMTVERLLDSSTAGRSISGRKIGAAVGVPCAIVLAIGLLAGLYIRRKSKMVAGVTAVDLSAIPGMPREFDFRELKRGTNNFDEKMKLGQGGYGVVYRATVAGEGGRSMEVAVKQFSGANTKGQENFLAELSIINRLRHRNLVKLIGWCHQNGVLLLVYDLMPNGSLDRHLFPRSGDAPSRTLSWEQRYKVAAGVASALNYLHHDYDHVVIHRDMKPSNIMLDAAFNARLGDFGLARALDADKTSYTDRAGLPGTLGYIAPECFHTGRATRESDVFGFGAVVLEIVCGRRNSCCHPAGCSQLLEEAWELHGAGSLLEAVDPRLAGAFDEAEAERLLLLGLACSHPNPGERPQAQAILQILTHSAPPPDVPASRPAFMWPAVLVKGDEEMYTSGSSATCSTVMTSSLLR